MDHRRTTTGPPADHHRTTGGPPPENGLTTLIPVRTTTDRKSECTHHDLQIVNYQYDHFVIRDADAEADEEMLTLMSRRRFGGSGDGSTGGGSGADGASGGGAMVRTVVRWILFEKSYIPENPRTPKPLTFSKNRLRGLKIAQIQARVLLKQIEKKRKKKVHICKIKKKSCTYANIKKKYRFFGKKNSANFNHYKRFGGSRSRFFERNNGLGDIGNWESSRWLGLRLHASQKTSVEYLNADLCTCTSMASFKMRLVCLDHPELVNSTGKAVSLLKRNIIWLLDFKVLGEVFKKLIEGLMAYSRWKARHIAVGALGELAGISTSTRWRRRRRLGWCSSASNNEMEGEGDNELLPQPKRIIKLTL
ncbi:hypothetical protein LXL04_024883 [Taraxacum kok-saghyz]